MSGFFTPVPLDFDQAFKNGDLTPGAYLVGCHLAAESFRARNTDKGAVTLHVSALAELCDVHPQTVRRALHKLEEKGWIRFAVKERQQGPWRVELMALSKPDEEQACNTLQHQTPLKCCRLLQHRPLWRKAQRRLRKAIRHRRACNSRARARRRGIWGGLTFPTFGRCRAAGVD